jgi:hypothetical protein
MMQAIPNKWIEKVRVKKEKETAPAYAADKKSSSDLISSDKPKRRFTFASRQTLVKTLRGIRR